MTIEQRIAALETRMAKLEELLTPAGHLGVTLVGKSSFPALKRDCDTETGFDRGTYSLPRDMYKTGTPIHAGGPDTSAPLVDTTATQTIGVTAAFSTEETVNVVNPDKWKDVQEIARLSAENADLQRRIDNSAIVIDDLAAKNTQLHREIEALKGNKT